MRARAVRSFRLRRAGVERLVLSGETLDLAEPLARMVFSRGLADPDEPLRQGVPTLADLRARGVLGPYYPDGVAIERLRAIGVGCSVPREAGLAESVIHLDAGTRRRIRV